MAEISTEDRIKLAVTLIEQSPPGEVNDVVNDIRAIISDDDALMPHVVPALRTYNLAQLHVVEHAATETVPAHTSLLSEAAIVPGSETERYVDALGKRSFTFDHVTLAVSDYQPYELPEEDETFRADLAKSLAAYTKNHFPYGHSTVSTNQFPLLPPAPERVPETLAAAPEASEETTAEPDNAPEPEATGDVVVDPETIDKELASVNDVVDEQVGSGDAEPSSTPLPGESSLLAADEVDQPGGLEKVDEAVEHVKEEEEKEEEGDEKKEATVALEDDAALSNEAVTSEEPMESKDIIATEESTELTTEPIEATEAEAEPVPERKQEHIDNPVYTLELVGNRYNVSNFWTGRWRTRWTVDPKGLVQGTILVDVHYYEQGNVQLSTNHTASFSTPTEATGSQSIASQIVTTIARIEANYQLELNDVYNDFGDKAFRSLRRALPVTRQKLDWEKVSGYTLGTDLGKARG